MKSKAFLLLSVAVATTVSVSMPAGAASSAPQLGVAYYGYDDSAGTWRVERHPRLLADVNGDKKADIVGFGNKGTYVSTGRADGKFNPQTLGIADFGYDTSAGGWRVERHPRLLGDVNGDGKIDIVGFSEKGTNVAPGNGNGTFKPATLALPFFGYNDSAGGWRVEKHPRLLGDVNGPVNGVSKADIVGFGNKGAYVSLST